MNRTTILSPTVASLAIIRDNPSAPPGAAIRHVAVFVANITSCGKHQFRIETQAFDGSEDGRDVTDWLASVIAPGTDIALRPVSSMLDPSPATDLERPSPWWPIADMAWLRQRFGEEPRIYTLNLSNSDIRERSRAWGCPALCRVIPGRCVQPMVPVKRRRSGVTSKRAPAQTTRSHTASTHGKPGYRPGNINHSAERNRSQLRPHTPKNHPTTARTACSSLGKAGRSRIWLMPYNNKETLSCK